MGERRKAQRQGRQHQAPEPDLGPIAHKIALLAAALQRRYLRMGVAHSPGSAPPLAETIHGRIVARHLRIHLENLCAQPPHPHADNSSNGRLRSVQWRQ
jgi:hypothetical protein